MARIENHKYSIEERVNAKLVAFAVSDAECRDLVVQG